MKIGEKIRSFRREKNMTLQELSKKSRVALATLSRIENNRMIGTLESHLNICRALQINLPRLYADIDTEEKKIDLHHELDTGDVYVHSPKASFDILTNKVLTKKMMPTMLKIEVGGRTNPEQTRSGTEKFLYLVKGKIELKIGDKSLVINEGDSLYFDASQPHFCKNISKVQVRCLCVITPPAL